TFIITYNETTCKVDVSVITVGPPATYTLGATGSTCTNIVVAGTYTVNAPMNPLNTGTVEVNVTVPGSYSLSTPVVNGISFSTFGDFISTGVQTVVLNATGTPTAGGTVNFAIAGNSSSCIFPVTINSAPSAGVYTLGGAGSTCTGFVASGVYASGTALSASNTVTLNVNVVTPGTYSISTTAANGVTFSGNGSFAAAGAQTITLTGSGTPTAAGAINHTVNGATGTCTFTITYTPPSAQAAYTLSGAPGACTAAMPAGTYAAGTPLTAANTLTVSVNVTGLGAYSLSTSTVNGITFSNSGNFTTLGIQNVVLAGSGTPIAAGAFTFTPKFGTSSCTYSLTVTSGGGGNFITCKINGVDVAFNLNAKATYLTPGQDLEISGNVNTTSPEAILLEVDRTSVPATVIPGTYTIAGSSSTTYDLIIGYLDPLGAVWSTGPSDPFTVIISTLTATRVTGTFSGTIRSNAGGGTATKIITAGSFNVPVM
ncbi:MAG: hypothetical protein ABIO05_00435, partial [Ferruginibacter sp.]